MNITKPPKDNHGFIYILSNESMEGIYKIGLTTNSVFQRVRELNSTGVPTRFVPEKFFQIKVEHLRTVEAAVHSRLKDKGHHHGKEFFKVDLQYCCECVEDTIYEVTGELSPDIIGLAKERKEEADRKRLWEFYERDRRKKQLQSENEKIKTKRKEWIDEQLSKEKKDIKEQSVKFFVVFFIYPILIVIGLLLYNVLAPGWATIINVVVGVWLYVKSKNSAQKKLEELNKSAELTFPEVTIDDIPTLSYVPAKPVISKIHKTASTKLSVCSDEVVGIKTNKNVEESPSKKIDATLKNQLELDLEMERTKPSKEAYLNLARLLIDKRKKQLNENNHLPFSSSDKT